ncbi:restriction endonuclease subunit S [Empedobacter sp.]|uniref:restriction endonuclease subunit S n=1 Tax=Empedobacter sp. TaxID=1927715 RepID=UPI00289ED7BE|nr:restriction endonuclease subunit S [Empedobacter sp.]
MNSDKKLIPNYRFPEFKNDGNWEIDTIDNTCDILNNLRRPITSNNRKAGEFPYYGASGIIDYVDNYIYDEKLVLVGEDGAKWGSFENTAFTIQGKTWVNNHAHVLRPIKVNHEILDNYLKMIDLSKYITGAAPPKLTLGKLKTIELPFPSNPAEQQKIAACLSSLDDVIAGHEEKLTSLEEHKKGLMQNLFPKEGETQPKYRFPEFENDGDWTKYKIKDIAKVTTGGTPESTNPEYWNGDIPWMNSGELNNKRIHSVSNYITLKGLKESSTKLIPPNCILIGLAGQGKTRGTAAINYIELCTNQSIGSIHPNEEVFISEFLYHNIDSMYDTLRFLSAGDGGRGGLNLQIIKDIEILLPSLYEQQKIASALSSVDELIVAQREKIAALKEHKKGLMQGLFPKIES